jgi:hypothetical protein
MEGLGELLSSDHRHTLEFFVVGLKDVSESELDQEQLLYNASILAHYAQVSTDSDVNVAAPRELIDVYDHFVCDMRLTNPVLLETAGAQCMLLSGFFEDQMRRRHNIQWYSGLGANFFRRSASYEPSIKKARLLETLATEFEPWRRRHARLSREMRDWPYLMSR